MTETHGAGEPGREEHVADLIGSGEVTVVIMTADQVGYTGHGRVDFRTRTARGLYGVTLISVATVPIYVQYCQYCPQIYFEKHIKSTVPGPQRTARGWGRPGKPLTAPVF